MPSSVAPAARSCFARFAEGQPGPARRLPRRPSRSASVPASPPPNSAAAKRSSNSTRMPTSVSAAPRIRGPTGLFVPRRSEATPFRAPRDTRQLVRTSSTGLSRSSTTRKLYATCTVAEHIDGCLHVGPRPKGHRFKFGRHGSSTSRLNNEFSASSGRQGGILSPPLGTISPQSRSKRASASPERQAPARSRSRFLRGVAGLHSGLAGVLCTHGMRVRRRR